VADDRVDAVDPARDLRNRRLALGNEARPQEQVLG
jgi:hypothetical protein